MSKLDETVRAELLAHVRSLAMIAVVDFENAYSSAAADIAAADMKQCKAWIEWLERVGLERGSRFS